MSVQDIPLTTYAEMTPNPNTIKFVANKMLVNEGVVVEYTSKEETIGSSPIAESLFNFPFVTAVFITRNFITVTKPSHFEWNDIRCFDFTGFWIKQIICVKIKDF